MALYDQFQWAPGEGMDSVSTNTLRQSQSDLTAANTQETKVDTATKQAELGEYLSQTAKDLRETERQTKSAKFEQERLMAETSNDYLKANPGILKQYVESGIAQTTSEQLNKANDAEFNLLQNTLGTSWDDEKKATSLPVYTENWNHLNEINPKLAERFVSPQDIAEDPSMLDAANAQMSHLQANGKQRFQQSLQGQKYDLQMEALKEKMASMERIQGSKNEITLHLGDQKDATDRYVADQRLEGVKYRADAIKSKQTGTKMKLADALGGGGPKALMETVAPSVHSLVAAGQLKIKKEDEIGFLSEEAGRSLAEWTRLNDLYFAGKIDTPPPHPNEILRNFVMDDLSDPQVVDDKGTFNFPGFRGKLNFNAIQRKKANGGDKTTPPPAKKPLPDSIAKVWDTLTPEQKALQQKTFDVGNRK